MMTLFFLAFLTSMWTTGLYLAAEPGMLLWGPRRWLVARLGEGWMNPVIDCPYCMPSLHGALITLAYHYYYPVPLSVGVLHWLFAAVGAVPLNAIVYNIVRMLRAYAYILEDCIEKDEPLNDNA